MMTLIIAIMINLLNGTRAFKNGRPKKAKIKEELIPVTWHPSRWWDWCMPEDGGKKTEKLWK